MADPFLWSELHGLDLSKQMVQSNKVDAICEQQSFVLKFDNIDYLTRKLVPLK